MLRRAIRPILFAVATALTACGGTVPPTPFPSPVVLTTHLAPSTTPLERTPAPVGPTDAAPDPLSELTIDSLTNRSYGGGRIEFEPDPTESSNFDRYLFHYPSDGLTIYGFVDVPRRSGPLPVVLVLHGYLDPQDYEIHPYTTRYVDSLAGSGFVALHPNFRNYAPSDSGPNLFRVGSAIDVLNLIALVRQQAGAPGPLESADGEAIGLFGHSMGGGIALRVLAVGAPVRAAVVYSSMNADEQLNFESIFEWSEGQRGVEELQIAPSELLHISPVYYLDRISVPLSIHHGEADELVPPEWSDVLCQRMRFLGKTVECFRYPNEQHTFIGFGGIQLLERAVDFFDRYLAAP